MFKVSCLKEVWIAGKVATLLKKRLYDDMIFLVVIVSIMALQATLVFDVWHLWKANMGVLKSPEKCVC